jgi:hypothetical protein
MDLRVLPLLFALVHQLHVAVAAGDGKENLTVSYLLADQGKEFSGQQGRVISGAMTYAVNQINADPNLLSDYTLQFIFTDTGADTLLGTKHVIEHWRRGAIAYFGPEDSCDTEARVAAAINLPMISYVSRSLWQLSLIFRLLGMRDRAGGTGANAS